MGEPDSEAEKSASIDEEIVEMESKTGRARLAALREKLQQSNSARSISRLDDLPQNFSVGPDKNAASWRNVVKTNAFRMDEGEFLDAWRRLDDGEELSKEELSSIYSHVDPYVFDYIYEFIDWDQSGTVNLEEFIIAMTALFGIGLTMDEKIEIMFAVCDKDHSGAILKDEFVEFLSLMMSQKLIPLKMLLNSNVGISHLREQLKEEYSEENLDFYIEVCNYERLFGVDMIIVDDEGMCTVDMEDTNRYSDVDNIFLHSHSQQDEERRKAEKAKLAVLAEGDESKDMDEEEGGTGQNGQDLGPLPNGNVDSPNGSTGFLSDDFFASQDEEEEADPLLVQSGVNTRLHSSSILEDPDLAVIQGRRLLSTYVEPDSRREVNLGHKIRNITLEKIKTNGFQGDTFRLAKQEIVKLMDNDSYDRFLSNEAKLKEVVADFFERIDMDHSGAISISEFRLWVYSHPHVLDFISHFHSQSEWVLWRIKKISEEKNGKKHKALSRELETREEGKDDEKEQEGEEEGGGGGE